MEDEKIIKKVQSGEIDSFRLIVERYEEEQALRDEIRQWAEENDVEPGFIMGMGPRGPGRGFGGIGGCFE